MNIKDTNKITFGNTLVKIIVKPNTRKCGIARVEDFLLSG